MKLYPHNQKAYEAVMQSFKTKQRAAVVHATGTGKSYIIAAVTEHFSKPLVLAPNDFVLHETQKVCKQGTDFKTYAYVNYNAEKMADDYDIIVCDEFHRTGATEWGASLQTLTSRNPQAKVLGTSANDIRYMDGCRDMAAEMFEGNVVSRITLADAITDGLLPTPTYVCSVYSIDDDVNELRQRISESKKNDATDDLRKLDQINANWQNAEGMPRIISKYVPRDTKRILAFCSSIESVHSIEALLSQWFAQAGFKALKFYRITSDDGMAPRRMKEFSADDYDGVKIALSVNMLNEGAHIPGVQGIIMLRSTMSRILAEQQIGRSLTTNNRDSSPFVLDCVNNVYYFDEKYGDSTLPSDVPTITRKRDTERTPHQYAFNIIDESRDIRDFLISMHDKYSIQFWTEDEIRAEALKYNTPKGWQKASICSYKAAQRRGILAECTAHMTRLNQWTDDRIRAEALKYNTPAEWSKASASSYAAALSRDIYTECTAHMTRRNQWTDDRIRAEALKYNMPGEWQKANHSSYNAAKKRGIFAECIAHMTKRRKFWTDDEIRADALKYNTPGEWKKARNSSYDTAYKRGIYAECTAHMIRRNKHKNIIS